MITVVVIDDERTNRAVLQAAIGSFGYRVEAFGAAQPAVDALPGLDARLVLLDWRLPGLSGARAVQAVRGVCAAPVVILTAYAAPEHQVEIVTAGADGIMTKPFAFEDLEALVRRHAGPPQ